MRHNSNLSRKRVPKSAAINDTIVSNKTDLKYGAYGIRAVTGKRVAANTIEAVRRCALCARAATLRPAHAPSWPVALAALLPPCAA